MHHSPFSAIFEYRCAKRIASLKCPAQNSTSAEVSRRLWSREMKNRFNVACLLVLASCSRFPQYRGRCFRLQLRRQTSSRLSPLPRGRSANCRLGRYIGRSRISPRWSRRKPLRVRPHWWRKSRAKYPWLFTLGPQGGATHGGSKVAEIGPVAPITAPEYLLRINNAGGPPGSRRRCIRIRVPKPFTS